MQQIPRPPIRNRVSKQALRRVRYLFDILKVRQIAVDQWRMPHGFIVHGQLEDFLCSVDCIKQLEVWIAAEEVRKFGYSEFFLHVSYVPPHWDAEVKRYDGQLIVSCETETESEATARLEALISYVKATGLASE